MIPSDARTVGAAHVAGTLSPLSSPEDRREHHRCAPTVGAPSRRGFLKLFGAALAGAAAAIALPKPVSALADPDVVKWFPGKVSHFDIGGAWQKASENIVIAQDIPSFSGNHFLSVDMITKEALQVLEKNLKFERHFDHGYGVGGARIGHTISVRKPQVFGARVGDALNIQSVSFETVGVQIDRVAGVDMSIDSQSLHLTMEQFSDRYIKPAVRALANRIDEDADRAMGFPIVVDSKMDQSVIRFVRDYDIQSDRYIGRFDVIYGLAPRSLE